MQKTWDTKLSILIVLTLIGSLALWLQGPISQDPEYHNFADQRSFLGIPNFLDVVSNLPFLLVGILGFNRCHSVDRNSAKIWFPWAKLIFSFGVFGVGFGSGYYHWTPTNTTLAWDRLPMTIAFMALFAMILADCVHAYLGRVLLLPLVFLGLCSVWYWHVSESQGRGDLRPYTLVQFLPLFWTLLFLVLNPLKWLRKPYVWLALCSYLLAKLAEHFDQVIFEMTKLTSGHTLKHLFAAIGAYFFILSWGHGNPKSPIENV